MLSCKQILSRILQGATDEFDNVPVGTIEKCIEGIPEISEHPVFSDSMNSQKIVGSDTVDMKPKEGVE